VKLTGFFQADAGWFHQDAASLAMPQLGDVQDDRGFRRTRLAAVGKVADNVSYMLEMDFAFNGRPSFMDVWAEVSKVPVFGNIRVGQFRQPFGLNELTSVKDLTFLERPSMFAMSPFRQIGIGFHNTTSDQNITWAASAFGTNTDTWGDSIGDSGYGMASRITGVLLEDQCSDFILHGGLNYSYISPTSLGIEYRNVPEYGGPLGLPGSVPFFVDTLPMSADNANLFNGELASTWGSWHAQSELRYNQVRLSSGGTAGFPSFYAHTGYILTGEHRPYDKANAVLGRIKPKNPVGKCGGIGAWELACRYSMIDLNQGTITGGEMNNVTFGVNWYLNDHTKFQFNYISSDLNRAPVGDSHTDIFATRCQIDF
jgi:phosphate-selective porin OprO and OprP